MFKAGDIYVKYCLVNGQSEEQVVRAFNGADS
jgi:hypothetical protein